MHEPSGFSGVHAVPNTLQSAGALNTNVIHSLIAKDTSVFCSNKLNEVLFLFQRFENNITANDNTKPGIQTPDFFYGANLNTPQQTIQELGIFR